MVLECLRGAAVRATSPFDKVAARRVAEADAIMLCSLGQTSQERKEGSQNTSCRCFEGNCATVKYYLDPVTLYSTTCRGFCREGAAGPRATASRLTMHGYGLGQVPMKRHIRCA